MKRYSIILLFVVGCNVPTGTKLPDINAENVDKAMSYIQKFSSVDSVSDAATKIVQDSATNFIKGKVRNYTANTKIDQWLDTGKLNARVGLVDSMLAIEQQVENILHQFK